MSARMSEIDILFKRYMSFISACDKPDMDPVTVFSPLGAKQNSDLELIREVSAELQNKKLEDDRKAAEAAAEAAKAQEEAKQLKAKELTEKAGSEVETKVETNEEKKVE